MTLEGTVSYRELNEWLAHLRGVGYPQAEARAVVAYAVTGDHAEAAEWVGVDVDTFRAQHQLARDRAGRAFERGLATVAPPDRIEEPNPTLREYLRDLLDPEADSGLRPREVG